MHPYNIKQMADRQKRKKKLLHQLKRMTVKELAEKMKITHQAIYKAIR